MNFLPLAFFVVILSLGAALIVEKRCVSILPVLLFADKRSSTEVVALILGRALLFGVFVLPCFSPIATSLFGIGLCRSTSAGSMPPASVCYVLSLSVGIMFVMFFS